MSKKEDKDLEELLKLASLNVDLPKSDQPVLETVSKINMKLRRRNQERAEVHNFLEDVGVEFGDRPIRASLLFQAYERWTDKPMTPNKFFRILGKHIRTVYRTYAGYKVKHYTINISNFNLQINAEKARKLKDAKEQKEKDKKIRN